MLRAATRVPLRRTMGAPRWFSSAFTSTQEVFVNGEKVPVNTLFDNKRVLVVGIVGAFTGVCQKQMPGYLSNLDKFTSKNVDNVLMVTVNDHVVTKAFGDSFNNNNKIKLVADFDASLTKSLGKDIDLTAAGLGVRSKRYALLVNNGKIEQDITEEKPGNLEKTSAEDLLKVL